MGVNPHPRKAFGRESEIDLLVKKIRHGSVVEFHGYGRADLFDQPNVFDQQRISGGRDSEAADFGGAEVA